MFSTIVAEQPGGKNGRLMKEAVVAGGGYEK